MTIKKVLFDTNPDAKAKRYCEDPFEVRFRLAVPLAVR